MFQRRALEPTTGGDRDLREERPVANPDRGIRFGQGAFGRGHIRPPLHQLRGHARRDRWRRVVHRLYGDRKVGRHLAQQHGNGVLILRAQQSHVDGRRFRRLQRRPRLDNRDVIASAGIVRSLVGVQGLLVGVNRLVQNHLQLILTANFEIIFSQGNLLRQLLVFQIRGAHLRGVLRFAHLIPYLAKQVRNPGDLKRRGPDGAGPSGVGR